MTINSETDISIIYTFIQDDFTKILDSLDDNKEDDKIFFKKYHEYEKATRKLEKIREGLKD